MEHSQSPILRVNSLTKVFSSKRLFRKRETFTAVDNISFHLNQKEILGFLGPNGAGKTTTIQMLLGLMTPTKGTIEYFGKNFKSHSKEILRKVTFASSYVELPSRLTVYENLDIFGRLYDLPSNQRKDNIVRLLKAFDLWEMRNKETGLLSAGQMTCVMLAKAFLPDPIIVLLDEPTSALDPEIALEVRKFILNQQSEYGVSILFTSHNMTEVTEICDRILVLKDGKIIEDRSPEEIAKKVGTARVHLELDHDQSTKVVEFVKKMGLNHKLEGISIQIDIDEHKISSLLNNLALNGIEYLNISIDKPTLEDYFLTIVKKQKAV